MIGFYNYTVVLTYIGTVFGFSGITYACNGNIKMALICLLVAGFCDMFDGKIASTMKRTQSEKRFGIQIDSLSDLICFGVLPAFIVLKCAHQKEMIYSAIGITYLLCALVRLAWFNVDEEERQTKEEGVREGYLGLPVTSAAIIFPLTIGVGACLQMSIGKFMPWVQLCVAIAFISPFKLKKPKLVGKLVMLLCGIAGLVVVLMGFKA